MKVLLTSLSGQLGGLELRLADETRELCRLGHYPVLAPNDFPGAGHWLNELQREGMEVSLLSVPPFLSEWAGRHFNLLKAKYITALKIRRKNYNLAHVAYAWTQTGNSHVWLAYKSEIPCVISVHNTFPYWKPPTEWHKRLIGQGFSNVKGVYGVSASALTAFESIYGEYLPEGIRSEVIYNFVDTQIFLPSESRRTKARRLLQVPDDGVLIGSIGRLDVQKNPIYVLQCFEEIRKKHRNSYLVFMGQGQLEKEIRAYADERGLSPWLRFTGFLENLEHYIPALDLHMLLSLREGFGIATVEAMACGVPVIGTEVSGTVDILRDSNAGLLVPLDDPAAVAGAASNILLNRDVAADMGKAGRNEAITKFSKIVWSNKIANFYDNVGVAL